MNSQQLPLSVSDAERTELRAIVASIDLEIARLAKQGVRTDDRTNDGGQPKNGLAASWANLVERLALGPEPEVRECPACKQIVRRAAILCGYCWTKLSP